MALGIISAEEISIEMKLISKVPVACGVRPQYEDSIHTVQPAMCKANREKGVGKRNVNTGVRKFIRQNLVLKKNSANLILQYITHIRANFAIIPQYKGLITASCFYPSGCP